VAGLESQMLYMTDAHLSGLAKELRNKGVVCETVHKLMRGHEDSRVRISDPEIVKFLVSKNKSVALITLDSELAEYCSSFEIPVIRVQDLVSKHIQSQNVADRREQV
jgi:rRNA-processing protein FCF1